MFHLNDLQQDKYDGLMIRRQKQFVDDTAAWFTGRKDELKSLHLFSDGSEPTMCLKYT